MELATADIVRGQFLIGDYAGHYRDESCQRLEWVLRGFSTHTFDAGHGRGIAANAQSNIYVAGRFSGTAAFGDANSRL